MTERPDITVPRNMLEVQGDRVAIFKHAGDGVELAHVLTLVRCIDVDRQEMRMINREGKVRKPDWPFTQQWYNSLRPARKNAENAKWEVILKAKA